MIRRASKNRLEKGDGGWAYAFIAVALVIYALFTAYPVINAFIISFQEYRPLGSVYRGFDNYTEIFKSALFGKAIWNTIVYTVLTVPMALLISFAVAVMIMPLKKWAQTTFKAIFYLPAVASGVALSVVWLWIYDGMPGGILNQLIGLFGIENQNWLGSSSTSMFSSAHVLAIQSRGANYYLCRCASGH